MKEMAFSFRIKVILVKVLQGNGTNRWLESQREKEVGGRWRQNTYNMYLYIIYLLPLYLLWGGYFKELAHAVMDIDKFKICRVGQQAGDSGESQCCSSGPGAGWWHISFLLQEVSLLCCSCLQLMKWGPPTLWKALLKGHWFKYKSQLKTPSRNIQNNAWPHIQAPLTHKINHPKGQKKFIICYRYEPSVCSAMIWDKAKSKVLKSYIWEQILKKAPKVS